MIDASKQILLDKIYFLTKVAGDLQEKSIVQPEFHQQSLLDRIYRRVDELETELRSNY